MRAGDVEIDVYIDVIFFVNFSMDILLLMLLKGILRKSVSYKRMILAGILGGISGCAQIAIPWYGGWAFAILAPGSMAAVAIGAFGWSGWRELIKETATLFLLSILAGGIMELLYSHMRAGKGGLVLGAFTWFFMAAGTALLIKGLWQFGDEMRKERQHLYPLVLMDGKTAVKATGYLDTGNCLQVPGSREGVHIVAERVWRLFQDSAGERAMIPYHTIGNPYGIMEGIRIEKMEIGQCQGNIEIDAPWIAKAPYGLSKKGGYEVLLYGETAIREDKEGGTTNGH